MQYRSPHISSRSPQNSPAEPMWSKCPWVATAPNEMRCPLKLPRYRALRVRCRLRRAVRGFVRHGEVAAVSTEAGPAPLELYAQTLSVYVRPQESWPNFHCSAVVELTTTTPLARR